MVYSMTLMHPGLWPAWPEQGSQSSWVLRAVATGAERYRPTGSCWCAAHAARWHLAHVPSASPSVSSHPHPQAVGYSFLGQGSTLP